MRVEQLQERIGTANLLDDVTQREAIEPVHRVGVGLAPSENGVIEAVEKQIEIQVVARSL